MQDHSAADGMRAAWDAGLHAFPLGANKRPAVREWAPYIETQPELDQQLSWLAADPSGYAVPMGGPQRLLAIDLEEAFVTSRMLEFADRLRDDELFAEVTNWVNGLSVMTPSGGCHIVIHLMGDDPVPGNEKLAMGTDGHVIAETRGQGGYIVGYGSNGDTHPSGGQWILGRGGYREICWVEPETWLAVRAVLISFDEAPLAPADDGVQPAAAAKSPAGGVSLAEIERGSSYLEAARDAMPPMSVVLERHGWTLHHQDHEFSYWTRPGKDPRLGHSATVNASDRLFVFSSNAHPVPPSIGRQTFSVIDVLAFYEGVSGGDIVRSYKPASPGPGAPSQPPSGLVLPADFWTARPYLVQVYDAALSGFIPISPDLVWQAVKTIYAATIPWNIRLPGGGTLDYIGLMVGESGSGKTSAREAALDLLPEAAYELDGVNLMLPPGTGEGIANHFIERDSKGHQLRIWPRAASFYVDEGKWLFDVAGRQGNTTIQALKQAWSGQLTGSLAAQGDRRRVIPPKAVRTSFLIGIQPGQAARLLREDLADEGLPQRVTWAMASHPDVGTVDRVHQGRLDVPIYDHHHYGGVTEPTISHTLTLAADLIHEIRTRAIARRRGDDTGLEGHADLACLKSAAVHAFLRGDGGPLPEIGMDDWALARVEWDISRSIRSDVLRRYGAQVSESAQAQGRAQAVREAAAMAVHVDAAASVLRNRASSVDVLTLRMAKDALGSRYRKFGVGHKDAIEYALAKKWLVVHSSGGFVSGGDA